jgi:hypothetical protein
VAALVLGLARHADIRIHCGIFETVAAATLLAQCPWHISALNRLSTDPDGVSYA